MLTIFTPAYNRAHTLGRLYESLLRQTCKDFCWLVVDDGSVDETKELVSAWKKENKISITYIYQENQGKPMAHNKGVELTDSELFTCVDSDDYLTDDAVEKVIRTWKNSKISDVGILAFKATEKGPVTKVSAEEYTRTTLKNAYDNLGLEGDTMLVFKSEIIKKYEFPRFENEKFVPESYLYDLIDQDGELILVKEALYICEYLEGGYTSNMARLLYSNPKGYFAYINQRLSIDKNFKERFLDSIRYVSMAIAHNKKGIIKNAIYPSIALLAYPAGLLLYYKKFRSLK